MAMTTWEERMAERHRGMDVDPPTAPGNPYGPEHDLHHTHLRGTGVECSCGLFCGVATVAFPAEALDDPTWQDRLSCSICGAVGVVALVGRPGGASVFT